MRCLIKKSKVSIVYAICIIAFMLVLSCDTDDSSNVLVKDKKEVCFSMPIISGITRTICGIEIGANSTHYPQEESFRVFCAKYKSDAISLSWDAFKDAPEINGEIASYNNYYKGWITTTPHFYENDVLYAFRALSPSEIKGDVTDDGIEIDSYKTPPIDKQFDLMFSTAKCDITSKDQLASYEAKQYNGVNLVFKHALSSIHFKVCISPAYLKSIKATKLDEEIKKFKINKIKIAGVYNKANFKENATITKQEQKFVYTLGTPQWTVDETSLVETPYEFLVTEIENVPHDGDSPEKDITSLDSKNHIGFMIPQKFSDKARIVVEWEYDEINQITTIFLNNEDENDLVHREWNVGLRYTYNIALSKDRIYFDPNISQQGEGAGDLNVE